MKEKIEEAYQFLSDLEFEYEAALTEQFGTMKEMEQRIRKLEMTVEEVKKKKDPNIDLFSPIGVHSLSNSELELKKELEEYEKQLPELAARVKQLQEKRRGLELISDLLREQSVRITELEEKKEAKLQLHFMEEQELERNRIARDLHDSTVQNLTMLVHKTELCTKLLNSDHVRVMLELQTMIETIKMTIEDMREIIYNLRPMSLSNLGLLATLESYVTNIKKHHMIETDIVSKGTEPNILQIQKITLYRIVQEACNNVVKYAKATKLRMTIEFTEKEIQIVIEDNGVGFDIERIRKQGDRLYGFGLSIMEERTRLLDGIFRVESVLQKGTTIRILVPVQMEKKES